MKLHLPLLLLITFFLFSLSNNVVAQTYYWGAWGKNLHGQSSDHFKYDNNLVAVAEGDGHVIALLPNGKVIGWGKNNYGQINIPSDLGNVIAIDAEVNYSVALIDDGTIRVWGEQATGFLSPPTNAINITAIATGQNRIAVLKTDSTVVTWGHNNGTPTPHNLDSIVAIAANRYNFIALKADGTVINWGAVSPSLPDNLGGIIQVAVGRDFTLVLKDGGLVQAYADNDHVIKNLPPNLSNIVSISATQNTGIAINDQGEAILWGSPPTGTPSLIPNVKSAAGEYGVYAIQKDGKLSAWGNNRHSQLHLPMGLKHVRKFAVAPEHTLAITAEGGIVAWGYNYEWNTDWALTHVPETLHRNVIDIKAASTHNLALKSDGTVVAWGGRNLQGELDIPQDLRHVKDIFIGDSLSGAIKADGTVVVWGDNSFGQQDIPDGLNQVKSVVTNGEHLWAIKQNGDIVGWGNNEHDELIPPNDLTAVREMHVADNFSLALLEDGRVKAWGLNRESRSSIPSGLANVIDVSIRDAHVVALKADSTVVAWGKNDFNQTEIPVGLSNVIQVEAGFDHSIALKADGSVVAWGGHNNGANEVPTDLPPAKSILASFHDNFSWATVPPFVSSSVFGVSLEDSIPITIEFDSPVTGFELNDLIGTNCEVINLTTTDNQHYQATLLPNREIPHQFTLSVYVTDSAAIDTTGLPTFKSNTLEIESWVSANKISGKIYHDENQNCQYDEDIDVPLSGFNVVAFPQKSMAITDDEGNYTMLVDTGSFLIQPIIPEDKAPFVDLICDSAHVINLSQSAVDYQGADFPLDFSPCPILNVEYSSNRRRRCFTGTSIIRYQNLGIDTAKNVKIFLDFPEYVKLISASEAFSLSADSVYEFVIGTLLPNTSGEINIIDSVECKDGITGLDQCTAVWISPRNTCLEGFDPPSSDWDASEVAVEGTCHDTNEGPLFTITNIGVRGMRDAQIYRIYQDGILLSSDSFQLEVNESIFVQAPPYAGTTRLEAEQSAHFPIESRPQATVESCSEEIPVRRSSANYFLQDDAIPEVSIDCLPIVDSYDPNDKTVVPQGITENHYVKPDTRLNYRIRFQNTGTDTAYTVIVTDTLSELMEIESLTMTNTSHDYNLNIVGGKPHVLVWTFNDIDLVDSITDEPNSHGFIKYSISPKAGLTDGTIVNNEADIYFDFNPPVRTNNAWINYYDTVIVSDDYTFGLDLDLPIPSLYASVQEYVNAPFILNVRINEPVVLDLQDINASNASVSDLTGSGEDYTLQVTPQTDGEVQLTMPEGVIVDEAGNGNVASNTFSIIYDQTQPSVDWTYDSNTPFQISFQFREEVDRVLTINDFDITGTSITEVAYNNGIYTLSLANLYGEVSLVIPAGLVVDLAGNSNERLTYNLSITSIEGNEFSKLTQLIPNPTTGKVSVVFPIAFQGTKELKVIDLLGRTIMTSQSVGTSIELDLANLKPGSYIVRIDSNKQVAVKLLVKE